jgi:fermentation-respiration switch protein FrsA (DUF1100 family)
MSTAVRTAVLTGGRAGWLYSSVILSFMALESRVLYSRLGMSSAPPNSDVEEVQIETVDGVRLHAWYCSCPIANRARAVPPVVLYCHGSSGDHTARWAPAFHLQRTLGADVLLFSFRGFGRSEGSPTELGLYRDGRAAWEYLTERRGIDPSRIILYGESLGTGVAIELAVAVADNRHRALILQSAYTSIPDIAQNIAPWAPVAPMMRNKFPSIERIGKHRRPLILIHGELDPLVPYSQAKRLYEAAVEPKLLIARADRGHNEVLDLRVFDQIAAFVKATAAVE